MPNKKKKPARKRSYRKDDLVMAAVDEAKAAAQTIAKAEVIGQHVGAEMVDDRVALHRFECLEEGYPGWVWEVSVARAPRLRKITVNEINLAPGPDALLAPAWVPWKDRLKPGDISRSDVLPFEADDPRLQPSFEVVDEDGDALEAIVGPVGYGRPRTLSQHGMDAASRRWYSSPQGKVPRTKPEETCANCGFLLQVSGPLGRLFGVCANEWSPDDGKVVSMDHTCGSHSETDVPDRQAQWPTVDLRIDDQGIDVETLRSDGEEETDEDEEAVPEREK